MTALLNSGQFSSGGFSFKGPGASRLWTEFGGVGGVGIHSDPVTTPEDITYGSGGSGSGTSTGVTSRVLDPLAENVPIVDPITGNPTPYFQRVLQKLSAGTGLIKVNSTGELSLADVDNHRLIGRNTSGSGEPEEVTISQVLDWIGNAQQGDVLYRGSLGWEKLGPGTSGQFLKTLGPGNNPVWATPTSNNSNAVIETKIFDGTIGTYTFSNIPNTYKHLQLSVVARTSENNLNAVENININGISTASYDTQLQFATAAGAPGAGQVLGGTCIDTGGINGNNVVPATEPGNMFLVFQNYTDTTFNKTFWWTSRRTNNTTTHQAYVINGVGQVRELNAISSITISLAGANTFINGSTAILTGIM